MADINIELKQIGNMKLHAVGNSGNDIYFDTSEKHGGDNSAATPFETFLSTVIACSAMDIIAILRKMKIDYSSFKIKLSSDRTIEHPKIPRFIDIEYILEGKNIPMENFEKAVQLSQDKYCSVSAVVKKAGIPVNWKCTVIGE